MKITKSILQQLIKEEIANVLGEGAVGRSSHYDYFKEAGLLPKEMLAREKAAKTSYELNDMFNKYHDAVEKALVRAGLIEPRNN